MTALPATHHTTCLSPLGPLEVVVEKDHIVRLKYGGGRRKLTTTDLPLMKAVLTTLQAYFKDPHIPMTLPINPKGTTFQKKVWEKLRAIPVGQTRTYGEIAREVDSCAQAVGNACRENPLPILIPCHRVVGRAGLGGYAGATTGPLMDKKQFLLAHEGVDLKSQLRRESHLKHDPGSWFVEGLKSQEG